MHTELENILITLETGTQSEVKEAKRKIEQLWKDDQKTFSREAPVIFEHLNNFEALQDPKNKAAFASGLSLFFLVLCDEHFMVLKKFVLKAICDPDGHVRESTRKTADWLFMSLSSRIKPFVYPKDKKLTHTQLVKRQKATEEFFDYKRDIEILLETYDDHQNDGMVYIQQMKPSIYKSLNMLYSDLLRGDLDAPQHISSPQIMAERKKIEVKLSELLARHKSATTLENIQYLIYYEEDMSDFQHLITLFHTRSIAEIENIVEVINTAWNYFPHKVLEGRCPAEIIIQHT